MDPAASYLEQCPLFERSEAVLVCADEGCPETTDAEDKL